MQKSTGIVIALAALLIGLGFGYVMAGSHTPMEGATTSQDGHMMPDGTYMGGTENMSMADMMEAMNEELRGKTGDTFDQAFLAEMIVHHQGAVEMAQLALTNAKHQEIKDLAKAIIEAQNKEITEMQVWQKNWYGR